jgi:hypothetical protein
LTQNFPHVYLPKKSIPLCYSVADLLERRLMCCRGIRKGNAAVLLLRLIHTVTSCTSAQKGIVLRVSIAKQNAAQADRIQPYTLHLNVVWKCTQMPGKLRLHLADDTFSSVKDMMSTSETLNGSI